LATLCLGGDVGLKFTIGGIDWEVPTLLFTQQNNLAKIMIERVKIGSVENSINYYMNLKKYNVPVEMHLYENGGHGFGLGTKGTHTDWPKACEKWLAENVLLN
jgi:acetyl esterase/lipase